MPKHSRKGFTLVEVMIASSLAAIIGLAMLQSYQNSFMLNVRMQEKFKHNDAMSIGMYQVPYEDKKKKTTLKELVREFKIDKSELRSDLGKIKIEINYKLFQRIDAANIADNIEAEEIEGIDLSLLEGLRIDIYKQQIKTDKHSASIFRLVYE